ncbi:hypothetical protein GBA52_020376, partial [Prunus armeniaca]
MATDWSRTGDGNRLVQDWGWKWADSRPSMAILSTPPLPIHDPIPASILSKNFQGILVPVP